MTHRAGAPENCSASSRTTTRDSRLLWRATAWISIQGFVGSQQDAATERYVLQERGFKSRACRQRRQRGWRRRDFPARLRSRARGTRMALAISRSRACPSARRSLRLRRLLERRARLTLAGIVQVRKNSCARRRHRDPAPGNALLEVRGDLGKMLTAAGGGSHAAGLRLREFSRAVEDFLSRTIEPHQITQPGKSVVPFGVSVRRRRRRRSSLPTRRRP